MSADHHSEASHGSYRSYIIGFLLSVVLTAIPFWVVLGEPDIGLGAALGIIFVLAAVQIVVHIHYFLHVTVKAENGWQAMSMIFSAMILIIVMSGSLWIMFHLEENMMPAHEQIERVRNLP